MPAGIYQIRNLLNEKLYIGSTVNLRRRARTHLRYLEARMHGNVHLQRAFDLHGKGAFSFEVLERVTDHALLLSREQYYFELLEPEYNMQPTAGSPLGFRHSLETRRQMLENAPRGEKHYLFGKHLSEEVRLAISRTLTGRPRSKESCLASSRGLQKRYAEKRRLSGKEDPPRLVRRRARHQARRRCTCRLVHLPDSQP